MVINPFWGGVLTVVFVELAAFFIFGVVSAIKSNRK